MSWVNPYECLSGLEEGLGAITLAKGESMSRQQRDTTMTKECDDDGSSMVDIGQKVG